MSYVHDSVTSKILGQLEQGVIPWRQRWSVTGPSGMPRNLRSDRPYSGIKSCSCGLPNSSKATAIGAG